MARKILEEGQQFGLWTVLGVDTSTKAGQDPRQICECKCGTVRSVDTYRLAGGYSNSCGCRGRKVYRAKAGDKFNRWEVIKDSGKIDGERHISCRCQCGFVADVKLKLLLSGQSGSCGCFKTECSRERLKMMWAKARQAIAVAN